MKKILLSIVTIALVGGAVAGFTGAFYGDTERSTGNTFVAGSVELKVDSVSHYNGMICTEVETGVFTWQYEQPEQAQNPPDFPLVDTPCHGTWAESDLVEGVHKFFNFEDIKPGDYGEDTISLHVYDNDAWGQFVVSDVIDRDNSCTEPEQAAENNQCSDPDGDGELDDTLLITAWLDQGNIPGFQCGELGPDNAMCEEDLQEGDNIWQDNEGRYIWFEESISNLGPFDLDQVLAGAYQAFGCSQDGDGHNDYGRCHGLAEDGRMIGSTTYYFGLAWDLDLIATGNEAQTDEYTADLAFRVEQHRNNPNPFQPTD